MAKIEIVGSGCSKCKALFENTKKAVAEIGGFYEIEKIEDITQIMSYGITSTPALVIDGEIKSYGRLLSVQEIKQLLKKE